MGQGVLPGDVRFSAARLRDRPGRQPREVHERRGFEGPSGAVVRLLPPRNRHAGVARRRAVRGGVHGGGGSRRTNRKSTRLNSSHTVISYAVFCLKKKK